MHMYHNKMAEYKHAEQIYKTTMCGMSYINIDTVCCHPWIMQLTRQIGNSNPNTNTWENQNVWFLSLLKR